MPASCDRVRPEAVTGPGSDVPTVQAYAISLGLAPLPQHEEKGTSMSTRCEGGCLCGAARHVTNGNPVPLRSNTAPEGRLSRALFIGSTSVILGAVCGSSIAQDYPSKPIRIVVGFSASSTTDILARTVGQKLNEAWGQPVLVDNRPSAGGIVAAGTVASAAPDGYTLLVVSAGHAATAAMFAKLPYDTLKDFAGVSRIANVPSILVVSPMLGVKSVKELVGLAKSKPGQLNFSSPGVGSANHL